MSVPTVIYTSGPQNFVTTAGVPTSFIVGPLLQDKGCRYLFTMNVPALVSPGVFPTWSFDGSTFFVPGEILPTYSGFDLPVTLTAPSVVGVEYIKLTCTPSGTSGTITIPFTLTVLQ